jgi:DNA-binding response OmpR family regulator
MRLLLAEDDEALRSVLKRGLRENGYVVDAVERGDDALHLLGMYDYALAVLDWRGQVTIEVPTRQRLLDVALSVHERDPTALLSLGRDRDNPPSA